MDASAIMDGIRNFFSVIDGVIYSLISMLYELIIELSKTSILKTTDIEDFAGRVYVFVGIIMLFKVTFSLISYLVNPDAITDKNNGVGNIAKNIIITLFLIIFVPYGFDLLYNAQSAIITDNLIPRLILGTTDASVDSQSLIIDANLCVDNDGNYITSEISDVGNYIALVTFKPFFQVYEDQIDNVSADTKDAVCRETKTVKGLLAYRNSDTAVMNLGKYIFDYSFFMSTITGILVMLLLLDFCFDIAMRCIKLGFLEIFAPIPIISYVDPKSGKDGMFKKWYREVFSTWARLFVRLVILFFVVYVITIVNNNLETITSSEHRMWIMLFLVIGALMFAKKAIPLIEDILGIKFDHSIELNPFKKIRDQAVGGKLVAGLPGKALSASVGLGVSGVSNVIANRKKSKDFQEKQETYNLEKNKLDMMNQMKTGKQTNAKTAKTLAEKYQNDLKNFDEELQDKMTKGTATTADYQKKAGLQQKASFYGADAETKTKDAKEFSDKVNVQEAKVESAKADMEKTEKANDTFSHNNQALSTIIAALRGAKLGFTDKEAENLGKAIAAGLNAAKATAKIRNDRDKFGLGDQLADFKSDLLGIKNQSGTTHEISGKIKELNEDLEKIDNGISMLTRELSMRNPGSYGIDSNGNISINENYNFTPGEREDTQYIIDQLIDLRTAKKDKTKSIKEYQEIKDLSDKRNAKK